MPLPSDTALAPGVALPDAEAVLALLATYLVTDLGRDELARLRFHRDPAELERLHRRLAQARRWRAQRGGFQFSSLEMDPRPLLEQPSLNGPELVRLLGFLDAAAELRLRAAASDDEAQSAGWDGANGVLGPACAQAGRAAEPRWGPPPSNEAWPEITALAAGIAELPELRQRLRAALLPDGELADDASPELARLRRSRQRQRQAIEAALAQHLRQLGSEGVLQDALVTVRHERFVLPVRTELRRRLPGIVHGASSSGQTVFVEPMETVELNNDYIRILEAEQAEIGRILDDLRRQAAASATAIAASAEACGALELESAKTAFALDYAAHPASFGGTLELVNARHPVLVAALRQRPEHAVVPLSLRLDAQRLLIVSGPNTGGKTVVLKTVGIAAWMAQCGLPVCAERASLPVFHALWADIGDVQSIEHNLSTFSSHLIHIRGILAAAGPESLILLDELGTATNAAEGAALAVEIAAYLAERRAWTLVTTHHDALKAWASAHAEVAASGSVAVDAETLAPSYQFRPGVPGLSAGLDMAARLGLPAAIIAGARARLTPDERSTAEYLLRLQRQLAAAEAEAEDLSRREQSLAARERELEFKTRQTDERDRAYLQRHLAALRAEIDRRLASFNAAAEARWRDGLRELQAELTSAQKRKLAVASARLKRETATAFQTDVAGVLAPEASAPEAALSAPPQPGDRVKLRSLTQPARVLRALGADVFEVEAGALRMQVTAADITAV
ncbi:MAG TPA: endonuclease MutS2, partial [Terriglobales bacterium]